MKEKYYELNDGGLTYILAPATIQSHETPKFDIAGDSNLKEYKGVAVEAAEAFVRM